VLKKKYKYFLFIFISLIIISIIIFKIVLYTPPLLDTKGRNIIEKTIDFLWFGWHFTKGSIYSDYLKDYGEANKELGKAGWYRKKFLTNYFGVNKEDLTSILSLYKELKINSISEQLNSFLVREQNK